MPGRTRQNLSSWKRRFRALLFDQVISPPLQADIEPTTRCNLRCFMCQTPGWSRAGKEMDPRLLEHILDTIPSLQRVKLQGMGEPLLHSRFFELAEIMVRRGIAVSMVTNGTQLHEEQRKKLCGAGIASVHVSIDTVNSSVSRVIRGIEDMDPIRSNVEKLSRQRPSGLRLGIMAVAHRLNRDCLANVARFAVEAGLDELVLQIDMTSWGKPAAQGKEDQNLAPQEMEALVASLTEYCARAGLRFTTIRNRCFKAGDRCPWPFYHVYITCDGLVQPCCKLSDPGLITFGPLGRDFEAIWNGKKYREFRCSFAAGAPPPCRMCYE